MWNYRRKEKGIIGIMCVSLCLKAFYPFFPTLRRISGDAKNQWEKGKRAYIEREIFSITFRLDPTFSSSLSNLGFLLSPCFYHSILSIYLCMYISSFLFLYVFLIAICFDVLGLFMPAFGFFKITNLLHLPCFGWV